MKKQYEMGYVSHVAALLRVMVSWTSLCARVLVLLVMSGESCPEKKSYIFPIELTSNRSRTISIPPMLCGQCEHCHMYSWFYGSFSNKRSSGSTDIF